MTIINIHVSSDKKLDIQHDELFANNGSIAALLEIEKKYGVEDRLAVDLSFFEAKGLEKIKQTIFDNKEKGRKTILMFSLLDYNAEETIKLIEKIKREHGEQVITVVGGQLVPFAKEAYSKNLNIDCVAVGDGEDLIPKILDDYNNFGKVKKSYEDWQKDRGIKVGKLVGGEFSSLDYDNYFAINDFLTAQREAGKKSQLVVQLSGGPGCAWAANNAGGACKFCALQNITIMNKTSLRTLLEKVKELEDKYPVDRFFDVANQFLPFLDRNQTKEWLKEFIKIKKELGIASGFFVYLTIGSTDEEIAKLLKEAGVEECFIGVDHFEKRILKEQNKSAHSSESERDKTLKFLHENGIKFEFGIVLGATENENQESLETVRIGILDILEKYPSSLEAISFSPVEIIQGSKVWLELGEKIKSLETEVKKTRFYSKAKKALDNFKEKGYLTREEKLTLSIFYMTVKGNDPRIIYEFEKEMCKLMKERGIFVTSETSQKLLDRVLFNENQAELKIK